MDADMRMLSDEELSRAAAGYEMDPIFNLPYVDEEKCPNCGSGPEDFDTEAPSSKVYVCCNCGTRFRVK